MAVSNSTDFDQTASELIKDALILVGGLEDDEPADANQQAHALRALNRMVKAWGSKGLKAWCWNELTLTLVASTSSYTIGPSGTLVADRPLRINNARKVISNNETEIRIVSREEYMLQPSKTSEGEPVFVYYDPQLTNGVLYVWPTPNSTDQIKFSAQQPMDDFDAASNNPYFPSEWLDAIVYNLALRLCPQYEVTGEDRNYIAMMAEKFLQEAEDGDMDDGSLYYYPSERY